MTLIYRHPLYIQQYDPRNRPFHVSNHNRKDSGLQVVIKGHTSWTIHVSAKKRSQFWTSSGPL